MTKVGKLIVGVIAIIIVVTGVFFLRGGSSKTIKVGFMGPLSGDAAVQGNPLSKVVFLAMAGINSYGGIDGRLLEVVVEDAQCNGTDAANVMQKLVDVDKVDYVIGGFCSSESLAAVSIAEANQVLLISGGSSSPDLTGISDYFVRTYPSDAIQGAVLAEISYNDKEWRTVAFMQEQTDYALGLRGAFTDAYTAFGGEVIHEEFSTVETDYQTALTKLKAEEPDALFISVQTPAVGELILQQMQDIGWNIPLLVSDVIISDTEVLERNVEVLEGALGAEFGLDPGNPLFLNLVDLYAVSEGVELPFPAYAQTMYDATLMLATAILEVGDDSELVAQWFREVQDWSGASGLVTIGSDGDRVGGHTARVIEDGVVVDYASEVIVEETGE